VSAEIKRGAETINLGYRTHCVNMGHLQFPTPIGPHPSDGKIYTHSGGNLHAECKEIH